MNILTTIPKYPSPPHRVQIFTPRRFFQSLLAMMLSPLIVISYQHIFSPLILISQVTHLVATGRFLRSMCEKHNYLQQRCCLTTLTIRVLDVLYFRLSWPTFYVTLSHDIRTLAGAGLFLSG